MHSPHPAPSTSTPLISVSTQIFPTLATLKEPKYRTHLGNFPKFRLKNQTCLFWLKIDTHDILEEVIPNLDLDFRNFEHKIFFLGGEFGPRKSKLSIWLKIDT